MLMYNVIFTTPTQSLTKGPATPTDMGTKQVEGGAKCCNFYNETHNSLDFTTGVVYNKA